MSEEVLAKFEIKRLSVLDENGNLDRSIMPQVDAQLLRRMYEYMVLARTYDERALALQREGRMGTYPSIFGQEAAQVGSALAFEKDDWIFPAFRESGVQLTLGFPVEQLFQYWGGDERGMKAPEGLNMFPICVAVGTHIPHAVGAALAARYKKDNVAVAAYFGDGATSKGDFHEALNLAGVMCLPVVFICQNNQWAISIPFKGQTACTTIAQKAVGYGFEGVQVDGNDVIAVYLATKKALQQAKAGEGPTLIECHTYRMSDHTTADDAARYRSHEEVLLWKNRDPLLRLERFMEREGLFETGYKEQVKKRATQQVDAGVEAMESLSPPAPADLFTYTVAELSPRQARQLKELGHGAA